eukprot:scaffold22.g6074.t1
MPSAADVVAGLQDTPTSTGGVARQASLGLPDRPPPNGLHTVYETEPEELYLGPGGRQQWMVNQKAPGQVPVYEGSWVQRFNAAGISVASLDNQGCGRSEGLRFYVERFDDLVADLIQLASLLRPEEEGRGAPGGLAPAPPLFVGGISLGGCIAYHATRARRELFRGCLLLAPMLSLERVSRQGLNPYLRPVARVLSRLTPTAAIVATDKNVLFPDIQALWDADPLAVKGKTRVRNAQEYLRICEVTMAGLEGCDFLIVAWHSENDTMCDCEGSKQLYLHASSPDKTLRLVNSMWHVLVCGGFMRRLKQSNPPLHLPTETVPGGQFKYVCVGYSAYDAEGLRQAAARRAGPGDPVQLPYCEGLEIVSTAAMSRKPELLTDGPELSSSAGSAAAREQQDASVRQRPGRTFVPGGGLPEDMSWERFRERFRRMSRRMVDKMGSNLSFIAQTTKRSWDQIVREIGGGGSRER